MLEEVIGLRVKKPESIEDELDEDELDTDEPVRQDLQGINDAVLQGTNLRTNSFVIECEKLGYYFPRVIIKISHKKEPIMVDLEIQFKFRPDMPEISIIESYIVEEEEIKPYSLDEKFRREILMDFFDKFVNSYTKIKGESVQPTVINI